MVFVEWIKTKKEWFLAYAALFSMAFLRYSGALRVGFLSDDFHWLKTVGDTPWYMFFARNIEGGLGGSSYGPVMNWWYEALWQFFGVREWGYHLASLFLVSFAALLIYQFARSQQFSIWPSFVLATLFLAIPAHTEAVVWVSAQPHLLAVVLAGISWYAWRKYVLLLSKKYFILAILFYTLSIFSKEIALLLPLAFLVHFYFNSSRAENKAFYALGSVLPFLTIAFAYLLLRNFAVGSAGYHSGALVFSIEKFLHASGMMLSYLVGFLGVVPWRYGAHVFGVTHPWLIWALVSFLVTVFYGVCSHKKALPMLALFFFIIAPFLFLEMSPVERGGERYVFAISFVFMLCLSMFVSCFRRYAFCWSNMMCASVFVIAFFGILFLRADILPWQTSSNVTKGLVDKIAKIPQENIVLFGLPDTVFGAEALRNGVAEAVFLQHGRHMQIERIPQYVRVYGAISEPFLSVQKSNTGFVVKRIAQDKTPVVFTGFQNWAGNHTSSTLSDFRQPGFVALGVNIVTTSPASVWLWNGADLVDLMTIK